MLIFSEAGLNLGGIIIMIFLIIGIISFLFSLFCVFIYYTIKGKQYTRKELWMNTFLMTFILLLVSGMICGMMIN